MHLEQDLFEVFTTVWSWKWIHIHSYNVTGLISNISYMLICCKSLSHTLLFVDTLCLTPLHCPVVSRRALLWGPYYSLHMCCPWDRSFTDVTLLIIYLKLIANSTFHSNLVNELGYPGSWTVWMLLGTVRQNIFHIPLLIRQRFW